MFLLLLLATGYLLSATPALAAPEFNTTFNAIYTVNESAVTTVSHQITLTNRFSHIYASQYSLTLGSTQIKNVQATTAGRPLPTTITTDTNSTTITIAFEEAAKVVGKDQTLTFTITYQNLDIAAKNGRVLEVNIPKLANVKEVDTYTVTLTVPSSFDAPTLVSPSPTSQQVNPAQRSLHFDTGSVADTGISVLFGSYQNFAFNLTYHLDNPGLTPAQTQIALPPDTAYQRLIYTSINPPPTSVTTDPDGNWLAQYQLKPQQKLDITATGNALIYLQPTVPIPPTSADQLSAYLKPQPYWPVTDPAIKDLAGQLTSPQNIYNYVTNSLKYNYDRIEANFQRLGAKAALDHPQNAICTEFTDLFVTLARAAGIPARDINGFAFTANPKLRPLSLEKDVLHAWPEYFNSDKGVWIPIDPTWGNTTQGIDYFNRLDLNHFTFAIHGQDSSQPYPAGSYKLADTAGKDVNITFADTFPQQTSQLQLKLNLNPTNIFSRQASGQLIITNLGNAAVHQPRVSFQSSPTPGTINATIPPYGQLELPLTFEAIDPHLTVTVNDTSQTFPINQSSLSFSNFFLSLATGIALAGVSLATGSLLVHQLKRGHFIPWQGQKRQN